MVFIYKDFFSTKRMLYIYVSVQGKFKLKLKIPIGKKNHLVCNSTYVKDAKC